MRQAAFRKTRLLAATALGLASAVGLAQAAHASGFGLREGSADWLGNAFVGSEAKAYDASTAWTNPAGMALLEQNQIAGNVSYIGPSASFTGHNTNPLYPYFAQSANVSGGVGGNVVAPAASGALFGVFVLSPDWRLGMSITNPYGERTSYPQNWVGRYQGLVSSITGVDFGLALSYKINNHLSVGAGPVIEYFDARLTQALNTPLSASYGDPLADVHGSNTNVGYNIGVLYKIDDATRVGLDYHSRIRHNISGTQSVGIPGFYYQAAAASPLAAGIVDQLQAQNSSARTSITMPDSLGGSIYHQVTPALALMGSLQWTDWSLMNSLHVTPTNGAPGTVIEENWRNTWFAGVGANYQVNDQLMLQTGFSFDESPVTDSNRTSRVPDANHYNIGFGAQYKVLRNLTFELAYAHVFTPGGSVHSTARETQIMSSLPVSGSGTQIGTYDASDNSVTAGMKFVF